MKLSDRVYVADSPIHGRGVFAKRRLAKGELIGRYEGPRARRNGTYVLWVPEGEEWYGVSGRNRLRYLNHHARPNAAFEGVELYALRTIRVGEEITFHYGDEHPF